MATTNRFDRGGEACGAFRPDYPAGLADHLAACAPATRCAVDVGCGTGQLTLRLARHFDRAIGLDPGRDQLGHAPAHPRIDWQCAHAESMGWTRTVPI